jgi:hypothetical protein
MRTTAPFSEYEVYVLREIASRETYPGALRSVLETFGNPLGRFLRRGRKAEHPLRRWTAERTGRLIEHGLIRTLYVGRHFADDRTTLSRYRRCGIEIQNIGEARSLALEHLDHVADTFKLGGTVLVGTEGALLGAATSMSYMVPGSQLLLPSLILADVAGSMTLLSRHTCRVASAYGFAPTDSKNLPHLFAAMAPRSQDADEGYIAVKLAAVKAVHDAERFLGTGTGHINRHLLERDAPQLIRLITYVARRLGVVISEKNLAVLVPVAGALLNSTVNAAFHRVGHFLAKDYFRRMILDERYGANVVEAALADQKVQLDEHLEPAASTLN